MEIAAFASVLGFGYVIANYVSPKPTPPALAVIRKAPRTLEGFESGSPLNQVGGPYRVRAAPVSPLKSRSGELDIQYNLPAGGTVNMEPQPSDTQGLPTDYGTQNEASGSFAFSDKGRFKQVIFRRTFSYSKSIFEKRNSIMEYKF